MASAEVIHELRKQFHHGRHTETVDVAAMIVGKLSCEFKERAVEPGLHFKSLLDGGFVRSVSGQEDSRCLLVEVPNGLLQI